METFFIILGTLFILSGYFRLMYIEDEYFSIAKPTSPVIVAFILLIGFLAIGYVNNNYRTVVSSDKEICPEIEEEIIITNGDTVKTTTYIYTFYNE